MTRMLAPITSEKHYVPRTSFAVAAGAIANHTIAEGIVLSAVGAATSDVRTGAVVKNIFCELWVVGTNAGLECQFNLTVEKIVAGGVAMTNAQSQNLQSYANKKNILYTTQGIVGRTGTNGVPVIRNWVKIPKGKQRIGLGDRLVINVACNAGDLRICGMFLYKEYF